MLIYQVHVLNNSSTRKAYVLLPEHCNSLKYKIQIVLLSKCKKNYAIYNYSYVQNAAGKNISRHTEWYHKPTRFRSYTPFLFFCHFITLTKTKNHGRKNHITHTKWLTIVLNIRT